jgi:hypothetical protein
MSVRGDFTLALMLAADRGRRVGGDPPLCPALTEPATIAVRPILMLVRHVSDFSLAELVRSTIKTRPETSDGFFHFRRLAWAAAKRGDAVAGIERVLVPSGNFPRYIGGGSLPSCAMRSTVRRLTLYRPQPPVFAEIF